MTPLAAPTLVALSLLLAAARPAAAAPARAGEELVRATLLADVDAAVPGKTFTLGVHLKIKPPWHTYWVNPGEAGQATEINPTGPAGFGFGPVRWPLPARLEHDGTVTYGYEGEVLLLVPVTVAADVPAGGGAALSVATKWQSCSADLCVDGKANLTLTLPVRREAQPANADLFAAWRSRLPVAGDDPSATKVLAAVEQLAGGEGAPQPLLVARWADAPPRKVEWFPLATRAVAVESVVVDHDGRTTRIRYKPTIYKPEEVPGGRVDSVLVYEDATGRRHGITVPFRVTKTK